MDDKRRVVVIGLDGATWNIIEPLVKEGKLPTIEKLMKSGCYGNLESCIPHVTFPAWKCYSTGKNPGKLGVYWFFGIDVAKEKVIWHNSTSFKSKELWDILGENDMTCGVLDMPTTYPPKAIKGFMVSHNAPRPSAFAYPEEVEALLRGRFGYKIRPDCLPQLRKDAAIPSMRTIINQRFDVARYMLKEFDPSFFHMTIFNIDTVQHFYWREMEQKDAKYGNVINDFWALTDSRLGLLLDEFRDENTYVILMSDHGFTGVKCSFNIGKWLMDRNLVVLKRPMSALNALLTRLGLDSSRVFSIAGKTRTGRLVRPLMRRPGHVGVLAIDWAKSAVIPGPADLLYLNREVIGSEEDLRDLKKRLITELKAIQNPKTGERLASEVYGREEIYSGRYVDRAPDIVISPNEGYAIVGAAGSKQTWDYSFKTWSALHRRHGIFLASGPDIREGVEIEGAKIYDLAPTILHIFGIPIPKDIDGRVLKEIFKEDSALARREIEYQEVDERARVRGKIRGLKAVGRI